MSQFFYWIGFAFCIGYPLTFCGIALYSYATGNSVPLWKFFHNTIIHPLMALPWEEPEWLVRAHSQTGAKCYGEEEAS